MKLALARSLKVHPKHKFPCCQWSRTKQSRERQHLPDHPRHAINPSCLQRSAAKLITIDWGPAEFENWPQNFKHLLHSVGTHFWRHRTSCWRCAPRARYLSALMGCRLTVSQPGMAETTASHFHATVEIYTWEQSRGSFQPERKAFTCN